MINAKTKNEYSGSNYTALQAHALRFNSREWATMKQWNELGYRVKPELNREYVRLKFFKDEYDQVLGRYEKKLKYFNVFNKDQTEVIE